MKHFTKSKKHLFEEFKTSSTGLIEEEVVARRKKYGENKFVEKEKDGLIKIFFNQYLWFVFLLIKYCDVLL